MKIKRFMGPDMRTVLRQVREDLGADAVILDTHQRAEGIEVSAAVDYEMAMAMHRGTATPVDFAELPEPSESAELEAYGTTAAEAGQIGTELRQLRQLLEQQLAVLAWNDFTRREPLRARGLIDLTTLGISRDVALAIAAELPLDVSPEQAQRLPYALLARRIQTCGSPCEAGVMLALTGTPGSGKTTTLAKLAVRWVLEHEAESLVIISADEERLGSHEQLRSLGRLLGAPVHIATGPEALARRLETLSERCFALIDTPGVAPRDAEGFTALAAMCQASARIRTALILPASAQAGVLEESVEHFGALRPICSVLTRLDEASGLGGALSVLARTQLPLAFVSEGARIPEDLHPARGHALVARAAELARTQLASPDEDLLARRFGGSVHAAA